MVFDMCCHYDSLKNCKGLHPMNLFVFEQSTSQGRDDMQHILTSWGIGIY